MKKVVSKTKCRTGDKRAAFMSTVHLFGGCVQDPNVSLFNLLMAYSTMPSVSEDYRVCDCTMHSE
jgi:hypothetical protein